MKNILIIGATSTIASAVAQLWAKRGNTFYLLGRNEEKLASIEQRLIAHGAHSVYWAKLEADSIETHGSLLSNAFKILGRVDIVLIALGTLPNQAACEKNFSLAKQAIKTNVINVLSLITFIANKLEVQHSGTLAVITSLAGERGRQSNYIYGSTKSMLSAFLQGLRNRLYSSNVHVIDIKPGSVATPMVAHKKSLLRAKPSTVAKTIVHGMDKHKHTIYTPIFWRWIMLIVKMIPEAIFKRLRL